MQRRVLLERLLPLSSVEMYSRRGGDWHRLGDHLPTFGVPLGAGSDGAALARALVPKPLCPRAPGDPPLDPIPIRVVRGERGDPRPARAVRCSLGSLCAWAESVTSARLAALEAAWTISAQKRPDEATVFVLGEALALPELGDCVRFWGGGDLLVPLGFRIEPELPDRALRAAMGAAAGELVALDEFGHERIPRSAFQPLGRAALRLALRGAVPGNDLREPGP
jgi:hypothetical protein